MAKFRYSINSFRNYPFWCFLWDNFFYLISLIQKHIDSKHFYCCNTFNGYDFILAWIKKKPLEKNFIFLISGMIAGIFAEVALSYHSTPEDNFNLLGHIYKLVFYAFTFHALFGHTVCKPFHDLEKMLNQTVSAISRALDRRDKYTFNHSVRVAEYACVIGGVMQADKKFIDSLRLSGLLHDIGKIAIPDSVLNKEGTLTEEEREMIKLHTLRGTEILEPVDQLHTAEGYI